MTRPECLKRAAECRRLADAESEPDLKLFLMRLGISWMQSATAAEEHELEEATAIPAHGDG
jgi:hypothetical protein